MHNSWITSSHALPGDKDNEMTGLYEKLKIYEGFSHHVMMRKTGLSYGLFYASALLKKLTNLDLHAYFLYRKNTPTELRF